METCTYLPQRARLRSSGLGSSDAAAAGLSEAFSFRPTSRFVSVGSDGCSRSALRNNVLPHIIEAKYLDIMDAQHM